MARWASTRSGLIASALRRFSHAPRRCPWRRSAFRPCACRAAAIRTQLGQLVVRRDRLIRSRRRPCTPGRRRPGSRDGPATPRARPAPPRPPSSAPCCAGSGRSAPAAAPASVGFAATALPISAATSSGDPPACARKLGEREQRLHVLRILGQDRVEALLRVLRLLVGEVQSREVRGGREVGGIDGERALEALPRTGDVALGEQHAAAQVVRAAACPAASSRSRRPRPAPRRTSSAGRWSRPARGPPGSRCPRPRPPPAPRVRARARPSPGARARPRCACPCSWDRAPPPSRSTARPRPHRRSACTPRRRAPACPNQLLVLPAPASAPRAPWPACPRAGRSGPAAPRASAASAARCSTADERRLGLGVGPELVIDLRAEQQAQQAVGGRLEVQLDGIARGGVDCLRGAPAAPADRTSADVFGATFFIASSCLRASSILPSWISSATIM